MYNNSVDKINRRNNMISADKARMLFKTEDESKEERINEVVDQILSLFEQYIVKSAKEYKSVSIPVFFGNLEYIKKHDISLEDEHIYIKSIGVKNIIYNNGIKYDEYYEVFIRVFDRLSKLGYKSRVELFKRRLYVSKPNPEGRYETLTISWE